MAMKPLTREQMQEAVDAVYVHRSQAEAARALGINRLTRYATSPAVQGGEG